MIIPEREYGRISEGAKVFHIVDWRRTHNGQVIGLCGATTADCKLIPPHPRIRFTGGEPAPGYRICKLCIREEERLRAYPVFDHNEELNLDGRTLIQAIELALKHGAPPGAVLVVTGCGGCTCYSEVALQWAVSV